MSREDRERPDLRLVQEDLEQPPEDNRLRIVIRLRRTTLFWRTRSVIALWRELTRLRDERRK